MEIIIDGYNINYKITGPGTENYSGGPVYDAVTSKAPAAVMLQGWATSLDIYDFVADSVNDEYIFVQLDLPGFGASDEPREPWNVEAYADFFCKFMDALGIRSATLIGHSYGGRVIIRLAERDDMNFGIDRIVLIDSAGIMPERSKEQQRRVRRYKMMRNFLTSRAVHSMFPEVIDYWMSKQGSEDYRNATPMMKKCLVMAVNEDQREALPKIRQETLLVWGDLDDATPIGDAHIMEEKIPDSALVVLEGTGHYSFLEKPAQFRSVLRAFMTRRSGGDSL